MDRGVPGASLGVPQPGSLQALLNQAASGQAGALAQLQGMGLLPPSQPGTSGGQPGALLRPPFPPAAFPMGGALFGAPSPQTQSSRGGRSGGTRTKQCNCKNSRCLKLYCECFASGRYCDACNCVTCMNNKEHEGTRQAAVESILERNPNAFRPKIQSAEAEIAAITGTRHTKGCNCKKSTCLKKYCECFQAGIFCGDICKCVDCKNYDGSEARAQVVAVAEMGSVLGAAGPGGGVPLVCSPTMARSGAGSGGALTPRPSAQQIVTKITAISFQRSAKGRLSIAGDHSSL
ncbi:hypothetical protein FOA52_002106 [Chlamydomonas sp. UWO 241]|nr:hypothetical protein FOA52_002106 [Chlamydomonas sp. UWO 241]